MCQDSESAIIEQDMNTSAATVAVAKISTKK